MAARPGFIIRNAVDVGSNLDLAEPDALDFSLIANLRYGVLRGCDLAISGWNVTVSPGVVVNNGSVLTAGGQVTLSTASQDARFDLIGISQAGGQPIKITGAPSPNPVFPDFDENTVILASVMVRPGMTPPLASDMTDKRVFVPERFVTALDSGVLLGSYNPTTILPKFVITHDGNTTWNGDTRMYRSAPSVLRIENRLDVGDLGVTNDVTVGDDLTVGGILSASNFQTGDGPPSGIGQPGWIYQNTRDGGIYTWEVGLGWSRLSTVPIPAGIIMSSLLSTEPDGWLFLNGQQVDEDRAGGLWAAFPQWHISTPGGERLQLPDYTSMFLRQGTPGQTGGSSTLTLTTDNLPGHKHMGTGQQMQPSGLHTHPVWCGVNGYHGHNISGDQGAHEHVLADPGHYHAGADGGGGGSFIAMVWGGRRRIDGPFNDASHPVSVQEVANTVSATTGVQIWPGGSAHAHWTDLQAEHGHEVIVQAGGTNHTHILNEQSVGQSKPIDLSPPFAAVRYLIKI